MGYAVWFHISIISEYEVCLKDYFQICEQWQELFGLLFCIFGVCNGQVSKSFPGFHVNLGIPRVLNFSGFMKFGEVSQVVDFH
uniref:Uncharacterized protein n=1 Tax=Candidatus Nitrotoga fabula TaxID=2182327 RepID=A0A2X0RGK5_9PROT|nr:protein of unknown function [Candidatus Nitrotoga fabula]